MTERFKINRRNFLLLGAAILGSWGEGRLLSRKPEKRRQEQNRYFLTISDAELLSESDPATIKGSLPPGTFVSVNYYSPDGELIAVNSHTGGYVAREDLSPIEEGAGELIFPDLDPETINKIFIRRCLNPESEALAKLRGDINIFPLDGQPTVVMSGPNQIVIPTGRRRDGGALQDKITLDPGSLSLEECEYIFAKNFQGEWDDPDIPVFLSEIARQRKVATYYWEPTCDFLPSLPTAGFLEPELAVVLQNSAGMTYRLMVGQPSLRIAQQVRWFPAGCEEKKREAASIMDLRAFYFLRIRPEVDEYDNEHPQGLGILNPMLAASLKEKIWSF